MKAEYQIYCSNIEIDFYNCTMFIYLTILPNFAIGGFKCVNCWCASVFTLVIEFELISPKAVVIKLLLFVLVAEIIVLGEFSSVICLSMNE